MNTDTYRKSAPVRRRRDGAMGIYVHVPFCARQCPYCDFAVDVRRTIPHREYADALLEEFSRRRHQLDGRRVRTIYFGGGTPSLWEPEQFARVLGELREAVGDDLLEVCLEANPTNITRETLAIWTGAGVNRLSIGCQSFQPRVLKALNRNHSAEQAREAVELAIEHGPPVVSLDLIFGNPEQTMQEWERDLDVVEAIEGLEHLSAYNLTIEPETAFARRLSRGRLELPGSEESFAMLERLVERCEAIGLQRYEVSNFARPGCRSRHNTLYWTGAEYLGIGVGAHSLHVESVAAESSGSHQASGVVRQANPRQTAAYLKAPGEPASVEHLSAAEHFVERLFLGVRTREGLDLAEVRHQFNEALPQGWLDRAEALLDQMVEQGFLERREHLFIPTHRGLNLADSLAERFFGEFPAG